MNCLGFKGCGLSRAPLALMALGLWFGLTAAALAQTARGSFPGRRIGGGTRDECTSRLLVHLVPASSVYAPGEVRWLGLLQGPAHVPMPVDLAFRPYPPAGAATAGGTPVPTADLTASPAGVTLLRMEPLAGPTLWSSHYRCAPPLDSGDPLAFVVTTAPPALSLLLPEADTTASDRRVRQSLAQLQKSCGGTVAREELARSFGLEDVMTVGWPAQLPVRCL